MDLRQDSTGQVRTGNGDGLYAFNHPTGLVNRGTITIGSTGKGDSDGDQEDFGLLQ